MSSVIKIFIALVAVAIVGGIVVLSTWQIPAPVATVEKVLPDDRFPH